MEPNYLVALKGSKLLEYPWETVVKLSVVEMSAYSWGQLSVLLKVRGSKAPLLDSLKVQTWLVGLWGLLKAAWNCLKMVDSTDAKKADDSASTWAEMMAVQSAETKDSEMGLHLGLMLARSMESTKAEMMMMAVQSAETKDRKSVV